ncbi:FAD-binding dehydrogenase [Sphingomonas gei]|uniref:FAD-binding dehydrogenase n=1 Tax=Sphingomonas gei TaxID=1395960 RepID=A0A4S1XEI7_9SPHN|nr:FAD-binding dehydrogenase [Sphingomonas gei]TGX54315.1 FAD-binding dehydrogenase [Sphingomonas gei]
MAPREVDVIVVGAGLAGLVAASEAVARGASVIVVDQEPEQSLGGQAFWSLGGLFLVNSPEQRRLGIRDSHDLAWQDWLGSAGFDRPEDKWPLRWAEAYVRFAAAEKRDWLRGLGVSFVPVVGWAERGDGRAEGHGNSVPRFHIAWGAGPGVVKPFAELARAAERDGKLRFLWRHRVDALETEGGRVTGVSGTRLAPDEVERGGASTRDAIGDFRLTARSVIVASGGIGGDLDLVRRNWPARMGTPPAFMVRGVPAHVDGRMIGIAQAAGARLTHPDRMWHYVEGLRNWRPIWKDHGIRILPGPSSMWFDSRGDRLPPPFLPGYDTLGTLRYLLEGGNPYSWFVLNQSIIRKEFALSGSEQNPDLTSRSLRRTLRRVTSRSRAPEPVEAFKTHGEDFFVANDIATLVAGMNRVGEGAPLDPRKIEDSIVMRDRELANRFSKDFQLMGIRNARLGLAERLMRTAPPRPILDPANGPLIAVRLNILTRKTLGGLETDLDARVLGTDGEPIAGLFAVGEAAGFGGGGMHGYRSLEGTFLGGCLFSGRAAGRAVVQG